MSAASDSASAGKSKKRPASSESAPGKSAEAGKKKFKSKAEVESELEAERELSKQMLEELTILRAERQKSAVTELEENWTCIICLEAAYVPIKICKAQSKHVACLSCALTQSSSCFFVPESSLVDVSKLEVGIHFDASSDVKCRMSFQCPKCRAPMPVIKVEDFLLGRMFNVFSEAVYTDIAKLAIRAKPEVATGNLKKCCWHGCDVLAPTTTDLILHVFECRQRLFHCPIGANPFQSHKTRERDCKQKFGLLAEDKTKDRVEQYRSALRAHATTSCVTRVGSCYKCPQAPSDVAAYGIPACEVKTHGEDHKKVARFWDLAHILLYDIFVYSTDVMKTAPLKASHLAKYENILDRLIGAHREMGILMVSDRNRDALRECTMSVLNSISNGKQWMNTEMIIEDILFIRNGRRLAFGTTPSPLIATLAMMSGQSVGSLAAAAAVPARVVAIPSTVSASAVAAAPPVVAIPSTVSASAVAAAPPSVPVVAVGVNSSSPAAAAGPGH
jgi:hypothetical protein